MMKNTLLAWLLLFTASTISAQSMTHCTLQTFAGEKIEGFLRNFQLKKPVFHKKHIKLYKGREFKKILVPEIKSITITSDDVVFKPRINNENRRSFMKVMQENEEFSVYVEYAGGTTGSMVGMQGQMMGGFSSWSNYDYYFIKDETYMLPYKQLNMSHDTYYETVDELILAMQKAAIKENVELPEYLSNYKTK